MKLSELNEIQKFQTMNKALKEYKLLVGSTFEKRKRERDIRKIIKLAGKLGWKYDQSKTKGKSFCVTSSGSSYPKGIVTEEYAEISFCWRKK